MRRVLVSAFAAAALAIALPATSASSTNDDWPTWRGPGSNGIATGAPPIEWSEDTNVAWKVPLPGLGSATPIIWDGTVYVLAAIGDEATTPPAGDRRRGRGPAAPTDPLEWAIVAYSAADGSEQWRRVMRSQVPYTGRHPTNSYASGSAITDGEHLWAFFGSYGLYCLTMDGEPVWDLDFGEMRTRNSFGEGASPAVHGDSLVVVWDQEDQSWIAAFDKLTGEERWKVDRDEPTTWATPYIVEHGDTVQVITAGTNRVRSYDLATGEELWEGPGLTLNSIPSPVYASGVVYLAAGFRGSALMAVDLDKAAGNIDGTEAVLWRVERDTPYVPSPLLLGDVVYYTKSNDAIISAVHKDTGEILFGPQRIDGVREIYASPTAAGQHVFILGRDGGAVVLEHGTEYKPVAQNSLDDGFDASPAIVGDSMYLRGRRSLYKIAAPE